MKTRKVLSLALAFALCLGLLPTVTLAVVDSGEYAEEGSGEEVYWKVYENGDTLDAETEGTALTLGIYGKGKMREWNNYSSPWDEYRERITRLVIEDGITNVSERFSGSSYRSGTLYNLKSIKIPSSVQEIGKYAFSDCYKLEEITVSAGNRYYEAVDNVLFSKGENPTLLLYPMEKINSDYSIPDHITEVTGSAFSRNPYLESVTWSKNAVSVPVDVFYGCPSLRTVDLSNTQVTEIETTAFGFCRSLDRVLLPASVTTIDLSAFWGVSSDEWNKDGFEVDIPAGVTHLECGAFPADGWLGSVGGNVTFRFHGNAPEEIDSYSLRNFLEMGTNVQIYYPKDASGWEQVKTLEAWNEDDKIHFTPYDVPAVVAQPSTQTVTVDGRKTEFAMYALKDAKGNQTNYIRVRDLAALLKGTAAQFEVGWNGNVTLTSKTAYTGSADKAPFHAPMPYAVYDAPTYVNGKATDLDAIQITYEGGGYTYYKLRDLAQALGFNVGWSAETGVYVETDKPYDPSN